MLKTRIIPCVLLKNGQLVKSIEFKDFRTIGHLTSTMRIYNARNVDELIILDIDASKSGEIDFESIEDLAKECFMPLTIGGGIKTLEDIQKILNLGADKISINSKALEDMDFISKAANRFGSQCIVIAIDAKRIDNDFYVHINAGKINSGIKLSKWVKEVQERGAGEILLTSMDADGTQNGFDIEMTELATSTVNIPVIASGGAGPNSNHFADVFKQAKADAALAASIFHFNTLPVKQLKKELLLQNIEVRI